MFVIPVFSVHQPASGGCSSRVLVSPNKHFAMKKLPLYISSLKSWRKHFVFSSVYLTGSGSLSLCNSLLSFCERAFTGRLPMKPLNVLSVFEKRTPVLGFSRGQASFDFCRQRNFYQDRIMRSFANSPPLAIWNLASRSETCRFFFSSPATS